MNPYINQKFFKVDNIMNFMAFIIDFYFILNSFLIKHVPEIVFSLVALIIILIEPYLIYLERAISSLFGGTKIRQQQSFIEMIRLDSFLVFLILVILILPLVKIYLISYLESILVSENLLFYIIVLFFGLYIYYVLVYRRQHSRN